MPHKGVFHMTKHSQGTRQQPAAGGTVMKQREPFSHPEPEMRRWPHPVISEAQSPSTQDLPAVLHYIHCALSYQNQLLSEIRVLLESLISEETSAQERK